MRCAWQSGLVMSLWATAALAGPFLAGQYKVNELGVFEFRTDGDQVSASHLGGGACSFGRGERVLEATLEGSLLIGWIETCAEPPSCGQLVRLPFLGVSAGGVWTAYLEGPKGCSTPGLSDTLVLTPTNSARLSMARAHMKREEWDLAVGVLRPAAGRPDGTLDAAGEFEVLYLLGAALNLKREFTEARAVLLKATTGLAPLEKRADVFYNLACAEAQLVSKEPALEKDALDHLKEALKLGKPGQFRAGFAADEQLEPLKGSPEFRRLSELAKKGLK